MKIRKKDLIKLINEQNHSSIEDQSTHFKNDLLLAIKNIDTFNLSNKQLKTKGINAKSLVDVKNGWKLIWETDNKKFETICTLSHKEIKKL